MTPTERHPLAQPDEPDRQHSAGGLVVRGSQILLIATQYGNRWQLPKGHLEEGETSRQAAEREVHEETGVRGKAGELLGQIEFTFRSRTGLRILKKVDYYLLAFEEGSARDYDRQEVSEARWFGWDDGIERLTFDNERDLVLVARRLVSGSRPSARG